MVALAKGLKKLHSLDILDLFLPCGKGKILDPNGVFRDRLSLPPGYLGTTPLLYLLP